MASLPTELVECLRGIGCTETMIRTADLVRCPVGWVTIFTITACPPVLIGDDGGHMYFDPTGLDPADLPALYASHEQHMFPAA